MAREEHGREDLLREATALVERIELVPSDDPVGERVIVGFRPDGAMSIYFGSDTAFHFNSGRELRRAHGSGLLYKAEQGELVSLERVRQATEVQLIRRTLSQESLKGFLTGVRARLAKTAEDIQSGRLVQIGQVPADADVLGRARAWLATVGLIVVAQSPHAR
jgi:hypothetical protein